MTPAELTVAAVVCKATFRRLSTADASCLLQLHLKGLAAPNDARLPHNFVNP